MLDGVGDYMVYIMLTVVKGCGSDVTEWAEK